MSQHPTAAALKLAELRRQRDERRRQEEEEERRLEEEARKEQEEIERLERERKERKERERKEQEERERLEREERERKEREAVEKRRRQEEKAKAATSKSTAAEDVDVDMAVAPKVVRKASKGKGKAKEVVDHVALPTKRRRDEDQDDESGVEKRKRAPKVRKAEVKRGGEFPCETCTNRGVPCEEADGIGIYQCKLCSAQRKRCMPVGGMEAALAKKTGKVATSNKKMTEDPPVAGPSGGKKTGKAAVVTPSAVVETPPVAGTSSGGVYTPRDDFERAVLKNGRDTVKAVRETNEQFRLFREEFGEYVRLLRRRMGDGTRSWAAWSGGALETDESSNDDYENASVASAELAEELKAMEEEATEVTGRSAEVEEEEEDGEEEEEEVEEVEMEVDG